MSASISKRRPWFMLLLTATMAVSLAFPKLSSAADAERKLKSQVAPVYPDLARKMGVSGTVKLEITISAAGTVKNVKVIGGHPLLVDAAVDAVKKRKYEPYSEDTTQLVEFKFSPAE